jgi:hypothetical protein
MSESDTDPYASPRASEFETKAPDATLPPRSLPREIIGTVVFMLAGALLGLMLRELGRGLY